MQSVNFRTIAVPEIPFDK